MWAIQLSFVYYKDVKILGKIVEKVIKKNY